MPWHSYREVDISKVMIHCSSTRIPSQKLSTGEIDLRERILVPAYNYGRAISVEKEDVSVRMGGKKVGFEGEVQVRICGMGEDYRLEPSWEKGHCML